MPARLMAPSLCAEDTPYLKPHEWLFTISYRHYHSFRDFQGSKKLPVPSPPEIYAQTRVHLVDITLTYAFTKRFALSLEVPLQTGSRQTYFEHDGVSLHTMHAQGLGDVRIVGNFWLFDPDKHHNQNISLRVGLKTPSGNSSATDFSFRDTGPVRRPVDPAIQPGDGGWGIILGTTAFKRVLKNSYTYLQGIYLSSPREMNGTQTPFGDLPAATGGDIGYIIDSVPDQYLGRVGITHPVWPRKGLSVTFGGRIDGVPSHDLIGGSEGWRLPGYSISIEPGVSLSRGKNFFELTVPIAVKRHGSVNVADARTHSPFAGIVSLADSQITLSYSYRF